MLVAAASQLTSLAAPGLASALFLVTSRTVFAWLKAKTARGFADDNALKNALATADLDTIGLMLRDRFGNVSIESFLDDPITQANVSKSLKRLAEVVNQPSTETPAAEATNFSEIYKSIERGDQTVPPGQRTRQISYVDDLDHTAKTRIGSRIVEIAERAELRIHGVSIWNALAEARRELEKEILPKLPVSLEFLSPRIFRHSQLRSAMGAFLAVANRAIHGDMVTLEQAERCLAALQFVGEKLPTIPQSAFSEGPSQDP